MTAVQIPGVHTTLRRGEDTMLPNWALDAEEQLTLMADAKVFKRLIRYRHYRDNTYTTAQLTYALEIDPRTVRSSLERLRDRGLVVTLDGLHCAPDAASRLTPAQVRAGALAWTEQCKADARAAQAPRKATAKGLQKDPAQNPENSELDSVPGSLKKGRKEERKEEQNTPPTPQGAEARQDTAPVVEVAPTTDLPEVLCSPDGEAAVAATPDLPLTGEVQTTRPARREPNTTGTEQVPAARRRAAAPLPDLPDDLAAVPGLTDAWAAWLQYRRERRLATAPSTATGMFNKLRTLAAEGHTHLRVLRGDQQEAASVALDLGGHVHYLELAADPLITPQFLQNQMAYNTTSTMILRNTELAGFLERYGINVEPPYEVVPDPDRPGQTRRVYKAPRTGAGSMILWRQATYRKADVHGKYLGDEPLGRAEYGRFEPVSPAALVTAAEHSQLNMYSEAGQVFVLMGKDATASGRSREVALADFGTAREDTVTLAQNAVKGVISTLLALVAALANQPRRYAQLDVQGTVRPRVIPPSPEDRRADREDVAAGVISKATARQRQDIDDPA
ncbi:hypothetical protein [Deinococcus knuensis]|uniref:Uncharacterized protein n=1 Tax=Deinococcus knuensis TaxID=1837380 RepID=A0ABQ2SAC2_9DEIO|nr:hypothetical protein [Deinococcus knuensis]GGS13766.1 hypothetical protein GCM10008961_01190 [Deinococcus knuensis]